MKTSMTIQTPTPRRQSGMSLIELMITIMLGMIVMAGVFALFGMSIRSSTDMVRSARLNQDMTAVTAIMLGDLKRAGYNQNNSGTAIFYGPSDSDPATEFADTADLTIVNDSCILYSYDRDKNGALEDGEFRGFKLTGNEIKMRSECTVGTGADLLDETNKCFVGVSGSCDTGSDAAPDEGAGQWESLTDSGVVEITSLVFRLGGSKCINTEIPAYWIVTADSTQLTWPCRASSGTDLDHYVFSSTSNTYVADTFAAPASTDITVEQRQIHVTIAGRLTDDPAVQKTMESVAKVRSSRVRVTP